MTARRAAVAAAILALTACVGILGLEDDKYLSFEEKFCGDYAKVCTDRTDMYVPFDKNGCRAWVKNRLATASTDPTHPKIQSYVDLQCPSKSTCADFMDCIAEANFIPPSSVACGNDGCLADLDGGQRPWRCCGSDHCYDLKDASGCFPAAQWNAHWSCLDDAAPPDAGGGGDAMPDGGFTLTLGFSDINNPLMPVPDLQVSACSKLDLDCMTPLEAIQGNPVTFKTLPIGFDGYLQARYLGPSDGGTDYGYMTLLVFFPPLGPSTAMLAGSMSLPMFQRKAYTTIVTEYGSTVNPATGHIFAFAIDCTGSPTAGVVGSIDVPADREIYFTNGVPSKVLTQTDMGGQFGFIDVMPGLRTITTQAHSLPVGSSVILVRKDAITFNTVLPMR